MNIKIEEENEGYNVKIDECESDFQHLMSILVRKKVAI